MRRFIICLFLFCGAVSCTEKETAIIPADVTPTYLSFDQKKAEYLYHFAFDCIDREFPNKLGQVLGDATYLATPKKLHPAFYGCFDWHSSVHGHWTLVTLLSKFPNFEHRAACLLYTSPSPRDQRGSRMPSSA